MTESIGTKYNTQIPSLTENADIQTALKVYHYGQATEPTNLVPNSVAGHLKTLEDTKVDIVPVALTGSGVNLNSQTTTGYYSSTNTVANSGVNYPTNVAGMLHVANDNVNGFVYQSYFAYSSNKIYWRGYTGSWTAWKEASDTTHTHSEFSTFQPNITGAASSITTANLTTSRVLVSDISGKVAASSSITTAELEVLDGISTSSTLKAQLDLKAPLDSPTFTTTATLPASTSIGSVTSTQISYLNGVTSAIQSQLNTKAPSASPTLTGTPVFPKEATMPLNVGGTITETTVAMGTALNGKPNTLLGNKSAGTPVPAGTKRIIIARENPSVPNTPDATVTPVEGDLWFW